MNANDIIKTSPENDAWKKLTDLAEATPDISLGYIGNVEPWGDDRGLRLWVTNVRHDCGNLACIWSCDAKSLTRREVSRAMHSLHIFRYGKGLK